MKLTILLMFVFTTNIYASTFNKIVFFDTVESILKTSMHKLSESEIYEAALGGVLAKLDEKNGVNKRAGKDYRVNRLLPPTKTASMEGELKGEITGIGAQIKFTDNKKNVFPIITKVLPGGALDAGVKAGDYIVKVDDTPADKFDGLMSMIYKIRGTVGSKVKLSLLRNGNIITKTITRRKITYNSTQSKIINKQIAYLNIKFINEKTYKEIIDKMLEFQKVKIKKIIVDLRGSSGGLFKEGIKVIKLFANKGDVVLKVRKMDINSDEKVYTAQKDGPASSFKLAVLVDQSTSSMAEGFVSMIKSLKKGIVIGHQTFGKATMETILGLPNGYAAKYTVGQLYDATDSSWANRGITPDISFPKIESDQNFANDKGDVVLEVAKNYLLQ